MNKIQNYDLNENEEIKNLLTVHGWTVEYFNHDNKFSVKSVDGSQIKNSSVALSLLIDELRERDDDESTVRISTTALFEKYGYTVYCESPLEVGVERDETILITGEAASLLEYHLRTNEKNNS